jgi:hypothetical protein
MKWLATTIGPGQIQPRATTGVGGHQGPQHHRYCCKEFHLKPCLLKQVLFYHPFSGISTPLDAPLGAIIQPRAVDSVGNPKVGDKNPTIVILFGT